MSPPFAGSGGGPRLDIRASEPRGDLRRVTASLHARPGALAMLLVVPEGALASLTLEGRALAVDALQRGPQGSRVIRIHNPPATGVALVADVRGDAPWVLADMLPGLAASATQVAAQRSSTRVPYQTGDLQIALRSVTP